MLAPFRTPSLLTVLSFALIHTQGCRSSSPATPAPGPSPASQPSPSPGNGYVGFDRNEYPGDDRLAALHRAFSFTGYWLTPAPGETTTGWLGKRAVLRQTGFGFLILADGRLDAQIKKSSASPAAQGESDGKAAAALAASEGFPAGAILFLDQEEGGRLLPEQAAYFFGWTEAVAATSYRPGAYLSGLQDPDGTGPDGKPAFITTAQDVQEYIARQHLHPVALWVYQDTCPPAPGCISAPPLLAASGTPDAVIWQYARSPRVPANTGSCVKTYAPDGNCYAGIFTDLVLDLNVAGSADPSRGR